MEWISSISRRLRRTPALLAPRRRASMAAGATFAPPRRASTLPVAGVLVAALFVAAPAAAQETPARATWSVVTANDVPVRSGPSVDSAYPFITLQRGALVKVVEETVGWARVPTVGPSFKEGFAYLRADRRVRLAADGRTAELLDAVDVLAPNALARFSPDSSWKAIGRIPAGRTVAILDTIEGQRDTMHRVALPSDCEGWINLTFLRAATDEELASLDPKLRPPPAGSDAPAPRPAPPDAPAEGAAAAAGGTAPGGSAAAPASSEGAGDDDDAPPPGTISVEHPASSERTATLVTIGPDGQPVATAVDLDAVRAQTRIPDVTLSDLEAALERLRREDPVTAEVGPLRQRYLEFGERPNATASERHVARGRAEQLKIQEEAQTRLARLNALYAEATADLEIIRGAREAMDARQPYVAVGRLNASAIYDGVRLPLLFRIQDPTGGQSVAYLDPGQGFDLSALLGQLVGVVGTRNFDPSLRVNLVEPIRIDVLSAAPK